MASLHIELLPPSAPPRPAWVATAAVALLAAGSWGCAAWTALDGAAIDGELERLHVQRLQFQQNENDRFDTTTAEPKYAAAARDAWQQGRFPTRLALTAMETVTARGVIVQSIDLENHRGVATLQVGAADLAALGQYIDDLNSGLASPTWKVVRVTTNAGASEAVSAVITSQW